MNQYALWNKKDMIITPVGEVFTAEQWMDRYPVARLDHIDIVCAGGEVNGGFFSTLGALVESYESRGCDFSNCATAEEKIQAINDFDAAKMAAAQASTRISDEELTATSLASIAASLEYQNMLTLDDVEEV